MIIVLIADISADYSWIAGFHWPADIRYFFSVILFLHFIISSIFRYADYYAHFSPFITFLHYFAFAAAFLLSCLPFSPCRRRFRSLISSLFFSLTLRCDAIIFHIFMTLLFSFSSLFLISLMLSLSIIDAFAFIFAIIDAIAMPSLPPSLSIAVIFDIDIFDYFHYAIIIITPTLTPFFVIISLLSDTAIRQYFDIIRYLRFLRLLILSHYWYFWSLIGCYHFHYLPEYTLSILIILMLISIDITTLLIELYTLSRLLRHIDNILYYHYHCH